MDGNLFTDAKGKVFSMNSKKRKKTWIISNRIALALAMMLLLFSTYAFRSEADDKLSTSASRIEHNESVFHTDVMIGEGEDAPVAMTMSAKKEQEQETFLKIDEDEVEEEEEDQTVVTISDEERAAKGEEIRKDQLARKEQYAKKPAKKAEEPEVEVSTVERTLVTSSQEVTEAPSTEAPVAATEAPAAAPVQEEAAPVEAAPAPEPTTEAPAPAGGLTAFAGVYDGPSGRETYYNLDMSGVVEVMRGMGYSEEEYPYWVREDGCKMLGGYIMVAADFGIRPRGTILQCSLGTAIVCDTGGFTSWNPYGLDIATTW